MSKIELALILALTAIIFLGGWQVRGWRDKAALEAQDAAAALKIEQIQKQAQADATEYEKNRAMSDVAISQLTKKLENYRVKNIIPADCFIPADGLHAVAEAVNSGRAR